MLARSNWSELRIEVSRKKEQNWLSLLFPDFSLFVKPGTGYPLSTHCEVSHWIDTQCKENGVAKNCQNGKRILGSFKRRVQKCKKPWFFDLDASKTTDSAGFWLFWPLLSHCSQQCTVCTGLRMSKKRSHTWFSRREIDFSMLRRYAGVAVSQRCIGQFKNH